VQKAIAVCANETIYRNLASAFECYATEHNWDLKLHFQIPDWFSQRYSRPNWGPRLLYSAYKLYLPTMYADYDLLALMDGDIVINPKAPCLSAYFDMIPPKGVAAVQDVRFEERTMFRGWPAYHYDGLISHDDVGRLPFPELHVNSGVMLVKPADVKEEWLELLDMDTDLNDEDRINLYLTQAGRAFILPSAWNVIYQYELVRRGLRSAHSRVMLFRKLQKMWDILYREQRNIRTIFPDVYALHFASMNKDILLRVDVEKLLRMG
jgi:hypothetical protein